MQAFKLATVLLIMLSTIPLLAQSIFTKDSIELHRTDTLYFEFGQQNLTQTAHEKVLQMAADRPGDLELYLEGHTDAVGSNAANERLAEARTITAKNAFEIAGWPVEAIQIRHFGERNLAISSKGREPRNRRVLLRSGLPRQYTLLRGTIRGEDGTPLPGGAIAHGTYLQDTVTANEEGKFAVWIPLDDSIRVDIFARQHFIETRELYVTTGGLPPPPLDIQLTQASTGKRLDIKNLYFVGNKTVFLPGGTSGLESLYLFMDYNKDINIELAGHVNNPAGPQPPGSWSHNLAGARAKTVYNYLVHRGIDPKRMRYRSYSNYEMVVPKAKGEAEMRQNRRVEIRIL